jgi:hypothetical protein
MDDERHERELTPEQGGGPPVGTAWTLQVEGDVAGGEMADLEHAAPLPRVGELLEVIRSDGSRRHLQVRQVVHVLQPSAARRPRVKEEEAGPNSIVNDAAGADPTLLRAGLPRVIAVPIDGPPMEPEGSHR